MRKYKLNINGRAFTVDVIEISNTRVSYKIDGQSYAVDLQPLLADLSTEIGHNNLAINEKIITAPIPGIIVSCAVKLGDNVVANQTVAVIEAMKMENNITAISAGKISKINITIGQEVEAKQVLFELE